MWYDAHTDYYDISIYDNTLTHTHIIYDIWYDIYICKNTKSIKSDEKKGQQLLK